MRTYIYTYINAYTNIFLGTQTLNLCSLISVVLKKENIRGHRLGKRYTTEKACNEWAASFPQVGQGEDAQVYS